MERYQRRTARLSPQIGTIVRVSSWLRSARIESRRTSRPSGISGPWKTEMMKPASRRNSSTCVPTPGSRSGADRVEARDGEGLARPHGHGPQQGPASIAELAGHHRGFLIMA